MLQNAKGAPHVVLIDLGLMEMLPEEDGRSPMPAGTPQIMAPEVISIHLGEQAGSFDERCDIYSLGICAFELLVGRPPYEVANKDGPKNKIDYAGIQAQIDTMDLMTGLAGRSKDAVELVT